jgi:hypothetical protein
MGTMAAAGFRGRFPQEWVADFRRELVAVFVRNHWQVWSGTRIKTRIPKPIGV